MNDSLARWRLAALVAAALVVTSCPLYLAREALRTPAPQSAARGRGDLRRAARRARSCHEKATKAWTGSHHDQAMTEATDGDGARRLLRRRASRATGCTPGSSARAGSSSSRPTDPDGKPDDLRGRLHLRLEAAQQYLVRFPGGRLQAFSVAWDTERRRWFFLYPGKTIPPSDWLHWTRNAQNWNGMCAECHSTNLVKGYDPKTNTYNTTWSEIDVELRGLPRARLAARRLGRRAADGPGADRELRPRDEDLGDHEPRARRALRPVPLAAHRARRLRPPPVGAARQPPPGPPRRGALPPRRPDPRRGLRVRLVRPEQDVPDGRPLHRLPRRPHAEAAEGGQRRLPAVPPARRPTTTRATTSTRRSGRGSRATARSASPATCRSRRSWSSTGAPTTASGSRGPT